MGSHVPDYLRRLALEGGGDPELVRNELLLCQAQATEALVEAVERIAAALEPITVEHNAPTVDTQADFYPDERAGLPATRKQLNYLEALISDVAIDDISHFEEIVGKPLGELTRGEASDWIGRLSGRAA